MIYIACVLYMIMPMGALSYIDRIIYGEWQGKPGDKVTEALNLLAISVSLFLYWRGARRLRGPRLNRVPLAAAGLLIISVLWSVAPETTITRSVAYFFLVVGAIGIAGICESHQVMRLTALIGGFLAAISLILPNTAADVVLGMRGPFSGKNQLGQAMAIGVLAGLHGMRVRGRGRFLYIAVTALCTTTAFLSKSATSLLTIVLFFILHIIASLYIKGGIRRMISICLGMFVVAAFIPVMINIDLIYSLLDKDPTLTGRTEFWPYIVDNIYQRPLIGWGFAAFWISNPLEAAGIDINEAHNGMLQLLLDIGLVGTAIFLFLWMRSLVMAVRCINGPAPEIGASALLLLVGILLIGVSEQVLTIADGVTAQFFLLGFMCEKELALARRARSAVALRYAALRVGRFAGPRREDAA
jgi:exopolysaccharide production protein ExoQ